MSYSLRFTEKMTGAFSFGEPDYLAGYRRGRSAGTGLMFRLTIGTEDVESFLADPNHLAAAGGYVHAESLGGRRPVEAGAFNLFVDEGHRTKHMLYRLYFSDSSGRPLTLAGYKDVRPGPLDQVWPETSTLYTRILAGHQAVVDGGQAASVDPVGSGVLRIRPRDFVWQLSTFRADGPSRRGELRALARFGRLFAGELWAVFDPLARPVRQ